LDYAGCKFFNLHVKNQYSKIKKDPILGKLVGKNQPVSAQNENLVRKNYTVLVLNENLYGKNDPILGCLVEKSLPDLGEIDEKGRSFLT
jgi:hypothetical protein